MYTITRSICLLVLLSSVVHEDVTHGIKPGGENIPIISTREGDNVTLPCRLGPGNLKSPAFDWKKDENGDNVFMYDGTRGHTHSPQFKGRVSLAPGGLQAGNADIILSNVTEKDGGKYKCILLPEELTRFVQLQVVVGPQVRLTIEEDSDGARLSCVSTGGLPQLSRLVLQNLEGVAIPAGQTANSTDSSGRYILHLDLRVTKPGNYTCLALQGDVNPARDTIQYSVVDPQVRLTIEEDSDGARLSCVSTGLVFQNQVGVAIPAGQTTNSTVSSVRYILHLDLRVTKPGNYTCRNTRQYSGNQQSLTNYWITVGIIIAIFVVVVFICLSCIYLTAKPCGHESVKTEDC